MLFKQPEVAGRLRVAPNGWPDQALFLASGLNVFSGILGAFFYWWPVFVAGPAIGVGTYLFLEQRFRSTQRRRPIPVSAALEPMSVAIPGQGEKVSGVARRLHDGVRGPLSNKPALVAAVIARDDVNWIRVRSIEASEFFVMREDGEQMLVTGTVWLISGGREPFRPDWDQFKEVGLHLGIEQWLLASSKVEEHLLLDGDTVEVQGESRRERVAAAGAYRDAEMTVFRGAPGRPILLKTI